MIFALLGAVLLFWASRLKPYKDPEAVKAAQLGSFSDGDTLKTDSQKYWDVRDSQLTPKFAMQNYGITSLALAVLVLLFFWLFKVKTFRDFLYIKTPGKRWKLVVLGLAAAVISSLGYAFDLGLGFLRQEFPPWADSMAIPLLGVPFIFLFLLVCAGVFSIMGCIDYNGACAIINTFRKKTEPDFEWFFLLGGPLFISILATLFTLILGQFCYMIPSLFWVFFFGFFYAGKQHKIDNETLGLEARP